METARAAASDPLLASPDENCLNYLSLLFRGRKKPRARPTNRRDERTVEDINLYLLPPSSPPPLSPPVAPPASPPCVVAASVYCFAHFWFGARQVGVKSASGRRLRAREGGRKEKGAFAARLALPSWPGRRTSGRAGRALKNERVDGDHHSLQTFIRLAYRMSPHLRSH